MKPTNFLLIIPMVLCLTLVGIAQLAPPGEPQPVIAMEFARYCVGDSWNLKLSNGLPDISIRLMGSSNGQPWEVAEWGRTDAGGNFREEGKFAAESVGSHTLKLDIGGSPSNTISFVVFNCGLKGRIAFVSTRDGEAAVVGPLPIPYIYIANEDGSGVTRLTQGAVPAWSGDGRKIAFQARRGRGLPEIRVIDADGSNERVLAPGNWPSWSPDGTKIVFYGFNRPEGGGIFMMNADGSNITQLISNEFANPGGGDYAVELPAWSPDGRNIAFVRANYENPWTVHTLDLVTSEIQPLRVGSQAGESRSVGDSRPVWSPDGTRLLLQLAAWSIGSINRNGSGLQTYAQGTYMGNPDWSPDGKSIVFDKFTGPGGSWSPLGSRMRIFIQSLEDGSVRQLIPDAAAPALPDYWDSEPAWSRVR